MSISSPQSEEEVSGQQASWATIERVSKTVNDLRDAQKEVVELMPLGFLGAALMDAQTGRFSGKEFGEGVAYEVGVGFIPFGKLVGKAAAKEGSCVNRNGCGC